MAGKDLDVDLGLDIASHRSEQDQPGSGGHRRHQGMERSLPRREDVRVIRFEREVRSTIVEVDTGVADRNPGTEPEVVALDRADSNLAIVDAEGGRVGGPRSRRL